MKDVADSIIHNWDWLKGKLDNDWDGFVSDSRKAIDRFNKNKDISSFENALLDSLGKTNKVEDFVKGCRMATNEPAPTKDEDMVQNSVNELAKKVRKEKTQNDSQISPDENSAD